MHRNVFAVFGIHWNRTFTLKNFLYSMTRLLLLNPFTLHFRWCRVSSASTSARCSVNAPRSVRLPRLRMYMSLFYPFILVVVSNTIFQHSEINKSSSEVEPTPCNLVSCCLVFRVKFLRPWSMDSYLICKPPCFGMSIFVTRGPTPTAPGKIWEIAAQCLRYGVE